MKTKTTDNASETAVIAQYVEEAAAMLHDIRAIQDRCKESPCLSEYVSWTISSLVNYGEQIAAEAVRLQEMQMHGKRLKF